MGITKTQLNIIAAYNANPHLCKLCKKPIIHIRKPRRKLAETRIKIFCTRSCAGKFNEHNLPKRIASPVSCVTCGKDFFRKNGNLKCKVCTTNFKNRIQSRQKGEVDQSIINGHARSMVKKLPKQCAVCGYIKFIEVCHRTPIRNFLPSATLNEINALSNLIILCPNCHWEFDHLGLIIP